MLVIILEIPFMKIKPSSGVLESNQIIHEDVTTFIKVRSLFFLFATS